MHLASDYIHTAPPGRMCRIRIYLPEDEQVLRHARLERRRHHLLHRGLGDHQPDDGRWLDDRAFLLQASGAETPAVFLNNKGGRLTTRSVGTGPDSDDEEVEEEDELEPDPDDY